jgi:hypothetical protein
MNNINDTNQALARAHFRDLATMITRNHGKEKTTQEIPSPRSVADGLFGGNVDEGGDATEANAGQQRQTIANAIKDCARTFLFEVVCKTITVTEHCRRMKIIKSDVSYALELFHRPHTTSEYIGMEDTDEVDDDKEDWNMNAEENGAEESNEEEDEEAEVEAHVGYNLTILPFSTTETKKFKNILLLPMLEDLSSTIPVSKDAVVLLRDAMYSFLIEKFSE